jgi:hypothetical protein
MAYDPNAAVERIDPKKAEVVVDSTSTIEKTPGEPAGEPAPGALDSDVSRDTPAYQNAVRMSNQIDTVSVQKEILALGPDEAKSFKKFCRIFNPNVLPRASKAFYESQSAESKVVWLFLRYRAMTSKMFLGGFMPTRMLNDEEVNRAIHAVISDPTISDVRDIPGFDFTDAQAKQVLDALTKSPRLTELWPELERFKAVA